MESNKFDLNEIYESNRADIEALREWSNEIYNARFAQYFASQRSLYAEMKSRSHPITDESLEHILTTLPLELFSAAEELNQLKLSKELLKLKLKDKLAYYETTSTESTATKRAEDAALKVAGDKLLSMAFSTLVERVEKEMSFSRELIMSAKKIWDSRRQAEDTNPISPVVTDSVDNLPDYDSNSSKKSYIG